MKRIYLSPPDVSDIERQLLVEAFDSNWIAPLGPMVDGFESDIARMLGCVEAVAVSSGTAGLHLALKELGVGQGDVVLCSTFTFAATANAILYCGATPVFIDSEGSSWNLDPNLLSEALVTLKGEGVHPRALVVVDLYGQCADYDSIESIARAHEIPVLEDAAEALGAKYFNRSAGTFGEAAVFSFNGNKIITTSGGGMVVSSRSEFIRRVRFLASQAREPAVHYEHKEIGFNYRMSNLLAALGRGQLVGLGDKITKRKRVRQYYEVAFSGLPGLEFMPVPRWSTPNYWLTCIVVNSGETGVSRDQIRLALETWNIESRPLWKPMHLQPVFQGARSFSRGVSDRLFRDGLCLPSGSQLTEDDLERICGVIRRCFPAGA